MILEDIKLPQLTFPQDTLSPILVGGLEVPLLRAFSVKGEKIFKSMNSFVNDLYDYDYTREQAKNNEEESCDDEEIDIKC